MSRVCKKGERIRIGKNQIFQRAIITAGGSEGSSEESDRLGSYVETDFFKK